MDAKQLKKDQARYQKLSKMLNELVREIRDDELPMPIREDVKTKLFDQIDDIKDLLMNSSMALESMIDDLEAEEAE